MDSKALDRKTLEWYEILSRALIYAAGLVLVLSVIGAISVATSSNSLPFFEDIQRESRGIFAIGALAGGVASAGVLSGLGAILRLILAEPLERARREQPLPGDTPVAPRGTGEPRAGSGAE